MYCDYFFKICLIAGKGVGKKTFINTFFRNYFTHNGMDIIGVHFVSRSVEIYGKGVRLNFWVFSDKESQFKHLFRHFINGATAVIFMYDIANNNSLNIFQNWVQIINNYSPDHPILLVGNKLDLEENREVSREQVEMFKDTNDITTSMEISMKTGEKIEEMFCTITRMVLLKYKEKLDIDMSGDNVNFRLEPIREGVSLEKYDVSIRDRYGLDFPHNSKSVKKPKSEIDYGSLAIMMAILLILNSIGSSLTTQIQRITWIIFLMISIILMSIILVVKRKGKRN